MGRPETDRELVRKAFAEFRKRGYWAREAQPDGWCAVPVPALRESAKVVFWHQHEAQAFDPDGMLVKPLHLQHLSRDDGEVLRIAVRNGLQARLVTGRRGGVILTPRVE